jgi:sialate O-acetylesterase
MLLQRSKAAVWGKADPGEALTVKLGVAVARTTADKNGNWRIKLEGLEAGIAGTMIVSGKNKLAVQNVAVGDVWICSGQSNMEMTVGMTPGYRGVLNQEQEIATAKFPQIRMFTVPRKSSETPLEDVAGKWEICTPDTVPHWSAVGYFFGRQLHQDLGIPIGLINSAWGGTSIFAWTPTEVLQSDPQFKRFYDARQAELANYPALKKKFENETLPAWQAAADAAQAAGKPAPMQLAPPMGPGMGKTPSALYNGMIAGATKYPITGAIWYQGETDAGAAQLYIRCLPAMIISWRKAWDQNEFPFYIVQLAKYMEPSSEPADSKWAQLREAQRMTALNLPNTGLAIAIDTGEEKNIHPSNKQEVGRRLALVAEAKTYKKNIVFSGPAFDTVNFDGPSVKIAFKPGTAFGLTTKDGGPVKGFSIAGEDKHFVWAEAKIIAGDKIAGEANIQRATLVLTSPAVSKPVAVRYAWANNPDINLVNKAGLPAVPFRTDNWPPMSNKQLSTATPMPKPATADRAF